MRIRYMSRCTKRLKIPKGQPEAVNGRRTDNTIAKRKGTEGTNNDQQNTTQITKDLTTGTPLNTGVISCASEE